MGQFIQNDLHDLYINMAISQFNMAQNAYIELMSQENTTPNDKTYKLLTLIKTNAIGSICFSAMSLESYINTLALVNISSAFAETIDRLDVIGKWIVVVKIGTGVELSKGAKPLQRISKNIRLRNGYIHNKTSALKQDSNGDFLVRNINPLEEYILPAYESLLAIKDSSEWLNKNWPDCKFPLGMEDIEKQINTQFKTVPNIWQFQDPLVLF